MSRALQKTFFRSEYGRLWQPCADTNSLGKCGGAVRAGRRSTHSGAGGGSLDAPTMSQNPWCGVAHGCTFSAICCLLWPNGDANPGKLGAIDVATAIGGLAAFAICALLLFQTVLTLRKLSGPQQREQLV